MAHGAFCFFALWCETGVYTVQFWYFFGVALRVYQGERNVYEGQLVQRRRLQKREFAVTRRFAVPGDVRMNSRMSKLRRSLSRSVYQLNNTLSRQSSLNGLIELPTISHTTLVDKFATPGNFRQLRDVVRSNNELLAEIVNAFEEKAALDFHYSKTLKKISAKLHKVTQQTECDIDRGWTSVAEQFDVHATLHSNLGSALTDDVVQPLRAIQTTQLKALRAADSLVDRETRRLKEKKEETLKLKRNAYLVGKELEKVEQAADLDKTNPSKFAMRKKSCKIKSSGRRVTENVLRKGVESLEAVEGQRLAHCQTALGRYQRKIEHLGPNLQQMFERHNNNLDVAVDSDVGAFISSLLPSTSAVNHVTLVDFYVRFGFVARKYFQIKMFGRE
ncbi:unnamed protein product [Caenorhabditis auriculariae]|uniref:FCH domain-containing protein n=1 Tax=Caenorhabditis auriculariae TaxID=2777116 RepID=A0A8S1GXT3_9PELO|nr:unnamed protein product [Caenorhabditis auriculariae]